MQATGELVAGQELDALVAEKVMGFCLHRPGYTYDLTHAERECTRCGGMFPDTDFVEQQSFKPSTDIASAWQVAERFSPTAFHMARNGRLWEVSFSPLTTCEILESMGIAETAPLAICRAALTAVSQAE